MAGKNFFQRFAAETGYVSPHTKGLQAVVAIHHNIVKEYRLETAQGTLQWKKELIRNGFNVATIPEEHAKRILGKRFQEQSYNHTEEADEAKAKA